MISMENIVRSIRFMLLAFTNSEFISQLKMSPLFRALALKCEIEFVCSSVHLIFYQTKLIGNWGLYV